ncbi:hypothetical protein GHT06_003852 [Daphnia sinensis]|uniref:Uncharacterized protein n=1 Tax=Daphnia sinensis TaxID=1820382 RepID=A0AAD5KDN9_9CRUS|nr:hypothetical protein GHT06_003852 [Daphnia sinensis]
MAASTGWFNKIKYLNRIRLTCRRFDWVIRRMYTGSVDACVDYQVMGITEQPCFSRFVAIRDLEVFGGTGALAWVGCLSKIRKLTVRNGLAMAEATAIGTLQNLRQLWLIDIQDDSDFNWTCMNRLKLDGLYLHYRLRCIDGLETVNAHTLHVNEWPSPWGRLMDALKAMKNLRHLSVGDAYDSWNAIDFSELVYLEGITVVGGVICIDMPVGALRRVVLSGTDANTLRLPPTVEVLRVMPYLVANIDVHSLLAANLRDLEIEIDVPEFPTACFNNMPALVSARVKTEGDIVGAVVESPRLRTVCLQGVSIHDRLVLPPTLRDVSLQCHDCTHEIVLSGANLRSVCIGGGARVERLKGVRSLRFLHTDCDENLPVVEHLHQMDILRACTRIGFDRAAGLRLRVDFYAKPDTWNPYWSSYYCAEGCEDAEHQADLRGWRW